MYRIVVLACGLFLFNKPTKGLLSRRRSEYRLEITETEEANCRLSIEKFIYKYTTSSFDEPICINLHAFSAVFLGKAMVTAQSSLRVVTIASELLLRKPIKLL